MADILDFPKQIENQRIDQAASVHKSKVMDPFLNAPPVLIRGSIQPYFGPWNYQTARHLLKRAMIAPNHAQITQAVEDGLDLTIQKLFSPSPDPGVPLNYNEPNDPNVPIGSTWVNATVTMNLNYPQRSLRAWNFSLQFYEGVSLKEKMVLFWHNHFVTGQTGIPKLSYQYMKLLRDNAFGNFRTLVEEITVNPLMLEYLNGNENNKNAPNENYARELLELFTIGKGELVNPGDYTNYTEEDIKEIARALTGWVVDFPRYGMAGDLPPAIFRPNRHDTDSKTLSHRFDNTVISNLAEAEYKKVIDVILTKDEVSRFMVRNFYRWFVYYNIDEEIEATVIEPLAELFRQENYEVQPVIAALLSSEHFYHENAIGAMIKSPVDFTLSTIKPFNVAIDFNFTVNHAVWLSLHQLNTLLQQDVFNPPDVAGWKAYYQEPVFYRNWINSVTLTLRRAMTDGMASGQIDVFGIKWGIDVLKVADEISGSTDPNTLIQSIVDLVLPYPLSQEQLAYLKETLIPGLPDFEWTIEYGQYLSNPTDETIRMAVENRLRALFIALLALPEFQLQ